MGGMGANGRLRPGQQHINRIPPSQIFEDHKDLCSVLLLHQRQSVASQASPEPKLLPLENVIDEEKVPGYNSKHFYPANPGDVLKSRYRLVSKIGWGSGSTVWLTHDLHSGGWLKSPRYVAIKICNCDVSEEGIEHEVDINTRLCNANPDFHGRGALGIAIEGYTIESPRGDTHLALVFEPLREPLWLYRRRVTHQERATLDSLPVFKVFIQILLEGLNYMHTQAKVIHTDLKLDNIMLTFEDQSTIQTFVQAQATHPMARKHVGDRTVYLYHNDFGPVLKNLGKMIPKITDFGLAQRGDKAEPLIHPIQPDEYRAPEVLLGLSWSYSADIWNLGTMIWELLAGRSLFLQKGPNSYSPAQHLADMVALIGDMPPSIIQREKNMRHWKWSPVAKNPKGKLVNNAADFYGGPFFTNDGKFVHADLIPQSLKLENELPECILEEDHVDLFLNFMRRMLCWVPEERATAAELLSDPWLDRSTWRV